MVYAVIDTNIIVSFSVNIEIPKFLILDPFNE